MRIAYVEDNPTNLALVERVASMNQHIIVSYLEGEVAKQELLKEKFDLILSTISAPYPLTPALELLRVDGTLVLLGVPPKPLEVEAHDLIMRRRNVSGSVIGGIPETQEMLDHCLAHNILADVEVIPMDKINESYERMIRGDVRYRFAIDLKTL